MFTQITPAGGQPFSLTGGLPAQGFQRLRQTSQSQIQDVAALGAADSEQILRGNKKQTLVYTLSFQLPDAETAAYFGPAFEAFFPMAGLIEYVSAAGTLYMVGTVAITEVEITGATCALGYRVVGGGFYGDRACSQLPSFPLPIG